MPFSRSNPPPTLSMDVKYLNQQYIPTSHPMDLFSVNKAPADPLVGDWSYDSAIDLFSLNPADMDPMSFDFADSLADADTKDLYLTMDPFAPSTISNGFTIAAAEDTASLSSVRHPPPNQASINVTSKDLDCDDQSWPNNSSQPLSPKTEQTPDNNPSTPNPTSTSTTSSTRCFSSPEIQPQGCLAPKQPIVPTAITSNPPRKTCGLTRVSTGSATSTTQDPTTRNAVKRAAHNVIEKRYRTNMNAKFLALEQAISPSVSGVHKSHARRGSGSLKKSDILTKALAYIEDVQSENLALMKEIALLRRDQGLVAAASWRNSEPSRV